MNKASIYILLPLFNFLALAVSAQDSTVVNTKESSSTSVSSFEIQPWMWIVGGIILLLILLALFRGGSKTSVTKTTIIKERQD